MWRTHEMRVPWKSELPRGVRMVRVSDEMLQFTYPTGAVLTINRWQRTTELVRMVWANKPLRRPRAPRA